MPLRTDFVDGEGGHTARANETNAAINDLDTRTTLNGSGSPEGVVTATPGRLYYDSAITRGASLWQKITGTGNTGWRVVAGETGRRDIGASLINGWTSNGLFISRSGNVVTLNLDINGNNNTNDHFLPMSAIVGFRPPVASPYVVQAPVMSSNLSYWTGNDAIDLFIAGATKARNYGVLVWHTSDTWPTALPGTAA